MEVHHRVRRDRPPYMHPTLSLFTKLFIYINDVADNGGPTAVVPGSHLAPEGPTRGEYAGSRNPDGLPQDSMPGCVKASGPAGTAFFFDSRIHHSAMPNVSSRERSVLVVNLSPFWHKQFAPVVEGARRLDDAGALNTPLRRQLFGIALAGKAGGLEGIGTSQGTEGSNPYAPGAPFKDGYW